MLVTMIVLGAVLLGLVTWWIAQVRRGSGSVIEEPDETVRKAQRREL